VNISPSSLNLFFSCPYRWKLTYIDQKEGIPIEDREALFGRMLHNIIQAYYQNLPENASREEVEKALEKAVKDYFDPMFERRRERVERLMENFKKFEFQRIKTQSRTKPELVEQKMVAEPFSGIIDFYNEGLVIDWKTRGVTNNLSPDYIRQGKIYEFILKRNGKEVRSVRFFSLEMGEFIPIPRMSDDWLWRQYNQLRETVEKGKFEKVRGPNCKYCEQILDCEFGEVGMWSFETD